MGSVAKLKGARKNKSEGGGEVSPPLLFIAFFTSYRSPLSERLEQATGYIYILFCTHKKPLRVLGNSELRQQYWESFKKGIEAVEGSWENNRDCHITMPLSLKTMEVQIKEEQ